MAEAPTFSVSVDVGISPVPTAVVGKDGWVTARHPLRLAVKVECDGAIAAGTFDGYIPGINLDNQEISNSIQQLVASGLSKILNNGCNDCPFQDGCTKQGQSGVISISRVTGSLSSLN